MIKKQRVLYFGDGCFKLLFQGTKPAKKEKRYAVNGNEAAPVKVF
jgi:hypothetical protein